jgi:hypothetical protein
MTQHLGHDKPDPAGRGSGNSRNGVTGKQFLTDVGGIELSVPRDPNGSFEPQIVRKGQSRVCPTNGVSGSTRQPDGLAGRTRYDRDDRAHDFGSD